MHHLNEGSVSTQIYAIGKSLGREMRRRHISKKEVADITGFSINTVNNVINGRNVTMHKLISVAWVVGLSLPEVLTLAVRDNDDYPEGLGIPTEKGPIQKEAPAELAASGETSEEQAAMRMGIDS